MHATALIPTSPTLQPPSVDRSTDDARLYPSATVVGNKGLPSGGTTLGNLALEVRRSTPLALAAQRGFLQGSIGRWLGQSCVARDFGGNPRQL